MNCIVKISRRDGTSTSRPFIVERPNETAQKVDEAILRYRLENSGVNIFDCTITIMFEADA